MKKNKARTDNQENTAIKGTRIREDKETPTKREKKTKRTFNTKNFIHIFFRLLAPPIS